MGRPPVFRQICLPGISFHSIFFLFSQIFNILFLVNLFTSSAIYESVDIFHTHNLCNPGLGSNFLLSIPLPNLLVKVFQQSQTVFRKPFTA